MPKRRARSWPFLVALSVLAPSVGIGCTEVPPPDSAAGDGNAGSTPVFYRGRYLSSYDVPYGEHERQVMDIHLRGQWADSDDRMNIRLEGKQPPTVVFIHGGAWYVGDKREWEHFISPFLQAGFNVVSLNYRLKEGVEPAIEDVGLALTRLHEGNADFGLDLDRVFLVGASSGGFMAMYHAAAANAEDDRHAFPDGLRIAGILNIVGGGNDCLALHEMLVGHEHEFWRQVGDALVGEAEDPASFMAGICPDRHFDEGDPPVLLAHGERDEFGPPAQYEALEAVLESHGTIVERIGYPDSGHTFIQRDWEDLFPRMIAFIDRHATDPGR